jgi:hypothetical protein
VLHPALFQRCGFITTICSLGQIGFWAWKYRKQKLKNWGFRRRGKVALGYYVARLLRNRLFCHIGKTQVIEIISTPIYL